MTPTLAILLLGNTFLVRIFAIRNFWPSDLLWALLRPYRKWQEMKAKILLINEHLFQNSHFYFIYTSLGRTTVRIYCSPWLLVSTSYRYPSLTRLLPTRCLHRYLSGLGPFSLALMNFFTAEQISSLMIHWAVRSSSSLWSFACLSRSLWRNFLLWGFTL